MHKTPKLKYQLLGINRIFSIDKKLTSQRTDKPLAMHSWPPSAGDRT